MTADKPALSALLPTYLKIGLLSFGGPAGQIALFHDELVDRRKLFDDRAFQRGLNVAMVLPGPEAQQLATWLGWRLHGIAGGLAAGLAFIVPGAILMIGLAWIAAVYGDTPLVSALFYGIQPAVLVVVLRAVWNLANRSLSKPAHWALAAAAFLAIWGLGLPFPLIVAAAAVAGLALPQADPTDLPPPSGTGPGHAIRTVAVGATIIAAMVLAVWATLGWQPYWGVAELFTSAAFVSFGGAYALLPYVADRAVETYGWLSVAQMTNGLALAESTPGPLILVNVYAGFFAGFSSGTAGWVTAALACFYTFAPSFMLILAAAPYVEEMQRARWIRRALTGVSAAVVGVVLNLAVYLAEGAVFPSGYGDPIWGKIAIFVAVGAIGLWRNWPMTWIVAAGALAGLGALALGVSS